MKANRIVKLTALLSAVFVATLFSIIARGSENKSLSNIPNGKAISACTMEPTTSSYHQVMPVATGSESTESVSQFGEQQQKSEFKLLGSDEITAQDGTTGYFDRYVLDDGAHALVLTYGRSIHNVIPHGVFVLQAYIRAICTRLENDKQKSSYMVYEVLDPKAPVQGTRMCKIDKEYADYIRKYAKSEGGVATGSYDEFVKTFGKAVVDDAPYISDETNHLFVKEKHVNYFEPNSTSKLYKLFKMEEKMKERANSTKKTIILYATPNLILG